MSKMLCCSMVLRTQLFITLLLVCIANAHSIGSSDFPPSTVEKDLKYVIFDTDMGADDSWALQMLLKAEQQLKNLKVLAITTCHGNTNIENVIKNTYRILDGINRTDIPIYKGASEAIIPINLKNDHFYGKNGFSDIDIWKSSYPSDINSIIQEKNAVEIIRDLVMMYPKRVSIFGIAPLTNIALAIKSFPEIRENINEVFIMGGSFKGRGNIVPAAEFNFYKDPESVHIVLNSLKCPITILPFMHISLNWRLEAIGNVNHTNVQLLNLVETIAFQKEQFYLPFDVFASAAFLFPDKVIQIMNQYNATMELAEQYTRGSMIINHLGSDFNVNIIEKISEDEFKKAMVWAADFE